MSKKDKILYEEFRTVLDTETGEIKEERKASYSKVSPEPEFAKLYLKDILYLANLPKGLTSILYAIVQQMDYKNRMVLVSPTKSIMAEELDVSISVINQAIYKLKKGKVIGEVRDDNGKVRRGMYIVNPYLVGRGQWKDIRAMRFEVDYDFKDLSRSVKTLQGDWIRTQTDLIEGENN